MPALPPVSLQDRMTGAAGALRGGHTELGAGASLFRQKTGAPRKKSKGSQRSLAGRPLTSLHVLPSLRTCSITGPPASHLTRIPRPPFSVFLITKEQVAGSAGRVCDS